MRRTRIAAAVSGAVVAAAGLGVAGAVPANAAQAAPMRGGCSWRFCGVVHNKLSHGVRICWAWSGSGCPSRSQATLGAHRSAGGNGKDVDGFYVPKGRRYVGYLQLAGGGPIPQAWNRGWHQIHNGYSVTLLKDQRR